MPKQDEKIIRETDRTVPVGPVRQSRQAQQPIAPPALDRRRQVVGTDELPARAPSDEPPGARKRR